MAEDVGDVWSNVTEIFSLLYAIGMSIKGIFESLIIIGEMIYKTLYFTILMIGWVFTNIFELINFVSNYILS